MKQSHIAKLVTETLDEISQPTAGKISRDLLARITAFAESCMDSFEFRDFVNAEISRHSGDELEHWLVDLRDGFIAKSTGCEKNRIESLLAASPDEGWQAWILLTTQCINQFEISHLEELCQLDLPFPEYASNKVEALKKYTRYMKYARWADTYPYLLELVELDYLPQEQLLKLYVTLGEIHQYHFFKPFKAKEFYSKAEEIDSRHSRVLQGWGRFFLGEDEPETAHKYFSELTKRYPDEPTGYIGMGEVAEAEKDDAEQWYKDAIKNSPGKTDGYTKLASHYIKSESTGQRKTIEQLVQQANKLSPSSEVDTYLDIGNEYKNSSDYKTATEYYNHALSLEPDNVYAYTLMGHLLLDLDSDRDFVAAREYFEKCVELLPESVLGFLNMAYACEQEEKWTDALIWYDKCPRSIDEYCDRIYAAESDLHRILKDYPTAETRLQQAFEYDSNSPWAKIYCEKLAEDLYTEESDIDTATRVYDLVLSNLGKTWEPDYFNRLGNMHYYHSDFDEARGNYEKAIKRDSKRPVFHRNLSGALAKLKLYDEAEKEILIARKIDNDDDSYKQKLADLYNSIGNDYYSEERYSEAIEKYLAASNLVTDDHVFYSNTALAYAASLNQEFDEELLDKAIRYNKLARNLNPKQEYTERIQSLQAKKSFIPIYGTAAMNRLPVETPIAVEVAADLIPLVEFREKTMSEEMQSLLVMMRDALYFELGHVRLPGVRVRGNELYLPDGTYIIFINEIPLVSGSVDLDRVFCNATVDRLADLNIKAEEATNPANGAEGAWISTEDWERAKQEEITTWGPLEYIILHLSAVLRKNFAEFVTLQTVTNQLQAEAEKFYLPIMEAKGGISRFTDTLKIFAEEEVPIIHLNDLCETYLELTARGVPEYTIVEELRFHEKIRPSLVCNRYGHNHCLVYELASNVVDAIKDGIITNDDAALVALKPELTQDLLTAVRDEVSKLPPVSQNPVVMTEDWNLRRYVKKIIELEFPHLAVVAAREISKEIETIGTIKIE